MELLLALPFLLGAAALAAWGLDDHEVAEAEPEAPEEEEAPDLLAQPMRLAVSDLLGAEVEAVDAARGAEVTVDGAPVLTVMGASAAEADGMLSALAEAGAFDAG